MRKDRAAGKAAVRVSMMREVEASPAASGLAQLAGQEPKSGMCEGTQSPWPHRCATISRRLLLSALQSPINPHPCWQRQGPEIQPFRWSPSNHIYKNAAYAMDNGLHDIEHIVVDIAGDGVGRRPWPEVAQLA
ncbi:hypothetical protein U9M48_023985 [Paspalum notatum var. saurae]|uniref:Uncharacterized protein n=1 Tax=Paspalum notatum var. saurae TaxID=547442 RepID=A0AAQ3WV79_PASNO